MPESMSRAYEARIDDVSATRRTVTAKINTGVVDRYRSVVLPSGGDFSNFIRTPAVLWEHGQDPTRGRQPIGHCTSIKFRRADDDILAVTRFKDDEYSQRILEDFGNGALTSFSIDFLPSGDHSSPPSKEELRSNPKWEGAEVIYRKWEMTGYSAVSYPGNPEALAIAVERGLWVPDDVRSMLGAGQTRAETDGEGDPETSPPTDPETEPIPEPEPDPVLEIPHVRAYTLEELTAICLRTLLLPMLAVYEEQRRNADDLARGRV